MNIKKIGLTALAGSLVATSVFAGEIAVTGNAGISFGGNDKGTSGNGFSMTDEIFFNGSGEMDNGWTVAVNMQLDNNAQAATGNNMDNRSVKITMPDMGVFTFSGHGGDSALSKVDDVMPTAYGETWDVLGTNGGAVELSAITGGTSNNMMSYTNSDLMDGLSITASYTPSGTGEVESSTSFAAAYTGVEGLTVGYAQGEENAAGTTSNIDLDTAYIKYAIGSVTAGYQVSYNDSSDSAVLDDEFTAYGITYAVSDNLSIGYGESTYDDGDLTTDQETSSINFSYTMGSMTLGGAMIDQSNRGGSTNAIDDVKGYGLDLSFAF